MKIENLKLYVGMAKEIVSYDWIKYEIENLNQ